MKALTCDFKFTFLFGISGSTRVGPGNLRNILETDESVVGRNRSYEQR